MDGLLELAGSCLAHLYAGYSLVILVIPAVLYAYPPVLAAAVWATVSHSHGRQPWPYVLATARRWVRLVLEIALGLDALECDHFGRSVRIIMAMLRCAPCCSA